MEAARETHSIVFLHPSDELYGADRVLLELVEAVPPGSCVSVWLPNDMEYGERLLTRELEARGIAVVRGPLPVLRRANLSIPGLAALIPQTAHAWARLRRERPDLLYVNTSALALMVPTGRAVRSKVVAHAHEHLGGVQGRLLSVLLGAANELVVVSEAVRRSLPGWLRSRAKVVHNGFALPEPTDVEQVGPLRCLLASRWNAWKGHDSVIKAWGLVERRDIRLIIMGGPPLSGAAIDVPHLVSQLPNRETVTIKGESPLVSRELAKADVVLVPSTRPDPLPTIAIEAAAAGRSVVASRIGGLPEIIEDGVSGWLVTPDAPEEWAAVLESLTRRESRTRGQAAREKYETSFTRERFRSEISGLLSGILRGTLNDPAVGPT